MLIDQGVRRVPTCTRKGFDMTLKRRRAFLNSKSVLYWNASAVLSNERGKAGVDMVKSAKLYARKNNGTMGEPIQLNLIK